MTSANVIIQALSSSGEVLEAHNLSLDAPISTPGGLNAGAFRGIVRPQADIAGFLIANAYVVADDLQFSRVNASVAAPEPGTFSLGMLGILPVAVFLRRRQHTVAVRR